METVSLWCPLPNASALCWKAPPEVSCEMQNWYREVVWEVQLLFHMLERRKPCCDQSWLFIFITFLVSWLRSLRLSTLLGARCGTDGVGVSSTGHKLAGVPLCEISIVSANLSGKIGKQCYISAFFELKAWPVEVTCGTNVDISEVRRPKWQRREAGIRTFPYLAGFVLLCCAGNVLRGILLLMLESTSGNRFFTCALMYKYFRKNLRACILAVQLFPVPVWLCWCEGRPLHASLDLLLSGWAYGADFPQWRSCHSQCSFLCCSASCWICVKSSNYSGILFSLHYQSGSAVSSQSALPKWKGRYICPDVWIFTNIKGPRTFKESYFEVYFFVLHTVAFQCDNDAA